MDIERGSTRSQSVENSLWKRLWTWRDDDDSLHLYFVLSSNDSTTCTLFSWSTAMNSSVHGLCFARSMQILDILFLSEHENLITCDLQFKSSFIIKFEDTVLGETIRLCCLNQTDLRHIWNPFCCKHYKAHSNMVTFEQAIYLLYTEGV